MYGTSVDNLLDFPAHERRLHKHVKISRIPLPVMGGTILVLWRHLKQLRQAKTHEVDAVYRQPTILPQGQASSNQTGVGAM